MTDLALTLDSDTGFVDLVLSDEDLAQGDDLRTAILISLLSDARADGSAELPEHGADRRGWWGDAFAEEAGAATGTGDAAAPIGSLLWLKDRSKLRAADIEQARRYAQAALQWLVTDGVVSSVLVTAEAQLVDGIPQRLALAVEVARPEGPSRQRYDFVWDALTGEFA